MKNLKKLHNRYKRLQGYFFLKINGDEFKDVPEEERLFAEEMLRELDAVCKLINERIKGDTIFEEAMNEIATFPQADGDDTSDVADAMRQIAINANDETRKFRYELKL